MIQVKLNIYVFRDSKESWSIFTGRIKKMTPQFGVSKIVSSQKKSISDVVCGQQWMLLLKNNL